MLPAVPGLIAFTALLERRRQWLLIVLTIAGFIVNAPTLISFYERYYQEATAAKISTEARIWNPRYAAAFQIWGAAWRETADAYENADQVGAFVHQRAMRRWPPASRVRARSESLTYGGGCSRR